MSAFLPKLLDFKRNFLLLQIFGLMILVRIALKIWKLPRVLSWLQPERCVGPQDETYLRDLAYYTDRFLNIFPANPRGNCLPRSLMLFRMARQQGFPVVFHCGVRKTEEGLDGHAWLSLKGQPFLEKTRQYQEMATTVTYPP